MRPHALARLLACVTSALVACQQLLLHPGWPMNDELLSWKYRLQMYALHFAQGDWFPIWSASDVFGQGSPLLGYYNKLFYQLALVPHALLGAIKPAVVVTVLGLLVVGALGMHRCLRAIGLSEASAVCLACVLPLASYTHANLVVRGALAELAAAMLVPWLIAWLLSWVRDERFGWSILPIMLLLWDAHAIIALYAVAVALVVLPVVFLPGTRAASVKARELFVRGAAVSAAFFLAIAPWLYFMVQLSSRFSIDDMKRAFPVQQQLRPLADYLVGQLRDGRAGQLVSVQLDLAVWGSALLGGAALVASRVRRGDAHAPLPRHASPRMREAAMLVLALGFLGLMQTPLALPAYAWVPGFDYIQFPWRLLSMITPFAILLSGWVIVGLDGVAPSVGRVLAATCLVGSVALSPTFGVHARGFIADADVESALVPSHDFVMLSGGEYLPVLALRDLRSVPEKLAYLRWLQARYPDANRACQVSSWPARAEQLARRFSVRCAEASEVLLPLMWSGLERVSIATAAGLQPRPAHRTPIDPRVHVAVPAGTHELHVELPSFPLLLGALGAQLPCCSASSSAQR